MITQNEGGVVIEAGNILIIAPDWASIQALNKAHADALAEIHQVGFDSKHQQGWTYASFDAIANVLRPVLAKHGLSVAPTMDDVKVEERGQSRSGNTELLATACISLALIHASGAMRITKHQGQGSDYSDKAINKAWTVAAKYALMRLFLISTGEKDENDDEQGDQGKAKPQAKGPAQAKAVDADQGKVTVVVNGKPQRPYPPETVKAGLGQRITKAGNLALDAKLVGAMIGALEDLFSNDSRDIRVNKRHMVIQYVTGKDSATKLTGAEVSALLGWASERLDSGEYAPDPMAVQEAALIVQAMDKAAGQEPLM